MNAGHIAYIAASYGFTALTLALVFARIWWQWRKACKVKS